MTVELDGTNVISCDKCPALCESRSQIVNGRGPKDARIVVVGSAPNASDDRRGMPFAGPAGTTLENWFEMAGIDAERSVYYTGAVRCRPPKKSDDKDREPNEEEIRNCNDFLLDEIEEIDPDIIIPAGATALKALYDGGSRVTQLRGTVLWNDELGKKMLPILHPSAAFHTWSIEEWAIADLNKAKIEMESPDENPLEATVDYSVCLDVESVEVLVDELLEADCFAFDTETTSLDWQTGKVLCIGFSAEEGTGVVVPIVGQWLTDIWSAADYKRVIAALTRLFASDVPKIGQNGKFDVLYLKYGLGIEVKNYAFDTMLAYHLFHEEGQGLSLSALRGLFTTMGDYDSSMAEWKTHMADCPTDQLWKYQAGDADCTFRVAMRIDDMLEEYPKLRWVFDNVVIPMSETTMHMEERGVLVDMDLANKLVETYDRLVEESLKALHALKGVPEDLNHRSPIHIRKLLFETLKLPPSSIVTDKAKLPSVKAEALEEIGVDTHPAIQLLITINQLGQIQKTFLTGAIKEKRDKADKGLVNKVSKVSGRLHTNYRVDGTETGRNSAKPNLQNVVGKGKAVAGAPIREIFIAPPGFSLMIPDFSQIELRGLAYQSKDENLIELLESGTDVHDYVARHLFNIPDDQPVGKEDRRKAKTFNFGLGYGMTEKTLAKRFGTTEERALELLDMYMKLFANLDDYFLKCRRRVKNYGFEENIFGRRRRFWGINTMKHFGGYNRELGHINRTAYNFPIQSSAADIHSLATIAVDTDQWLKDAGVLCIGTIHDSVILEVPTEMNEEVARYVQKLMYNSAKETSGWHVPVEVEVGPRWETVTHMLNSDGDWGTPEEIEAIALAKKAA